ncbi:MAG TPA: CDP-alcohol phosphatidyltransferase family protein [Polyangiaceae bacterium]|nr:CDP-alcohol phosphatidyltransferase family protein [Polyangiaceae bacterium]
MTKQYSAGTPGREGRRPSVWLPAGACKAALAAVDGVAGLLVEVGVPANAVTLGSIVLGLLAGLLVGFGRFGPAAVALGIASLGDAIDGAVARRAGAVSIGGALLDASGDRYQELFFLGGAAVYFRASAVALVATLLAIGGSFMVSYGSAKAEALHVPVPPGAMRRTERAVCLFLGTMLSSWFARTAAASAVAPGWMPGLPLVAAVVVVATVANASAVRRLMMLARAASPMARPVRISVRPSVTERAGKREEGRLVW